MPGPYNVVRLRPLPGAALRRRTALRPPILLADEPTGNLDSATGAVVLELILTLHREENATMVMVTHEQSLADCADRRIILRDGVVAPHP